MQGLILINAYPKGEKFYRQAERIKEELEKLGVEAQIKRNGEYAAWLSSDGAARFEAEGYDFVVYLDKDKYLGELLEQKGLRLFNPSKAVEACDDKMRTFLALKQSGITIPKTVAASLCYTKGAKADEAFLQNTANLLGFPMVAKKCYGSFGEGVELVHGIAELKELAQKWLFEPHLYQEYIAESKGEDLRVIVVGGKALGAMKRVAKNGEFRSNIELGGRGEKTELAPEYRKAAERAATALGLDYCGVDLLETNGGPVLCEVNSNAFFEGFESTTGINVAKSYAEHIVNVMKNGRR
ncbi:MAG: RimK family alpha-L-glutamate ligase [Clostridia bacterium]|nr:RimK family alpha-L-glutamate ligase [Clostridia bacterium]